MRRCRVPGCDRVAVFATKLLCRRHYDRARYRVMQGISWEVVLGPLGIALLMERFERSGLPTPPAKVNHILRRATQAQPIPERIWQAGDQPSTRSCITCENLLPVEPRFLCCGKNAWPSGVIKVALRHTEECGLPPALHQFARNCPYYAMFRRTGSRKAW